MEYEVTTDRNGPITAEIDRTPKPYESNVAPITEYGGVDYDRLIRIGGYTMSVKTALNAGLLNLPGEGGAPVTQPAPAATSGMSREPSLLEELEKFERMRQEQGWQGADGLKLGPSEKQAPPLDPDKVEGESLGDEMEALLDDTLQRAGSSQIVAAVNAAAAGQELSQEVINQAAADMGLEPEEVAQVYSQIKGAFEAQALAALKDMGLDQRAVQWAYENEPELFEEAVRRHTFDRTTDGYRELGRRYIEKLDQIEPQAVLAGLPPDTHPRIVPGPGGRDIIVFETPQGEMSWRSAVLLGLVNSVAWE